jgi:tetratricopeptide (TPR) repeat protein
LPSLVRHELTIAHQDAALDGGIEGVREYAFTHQILHQVTYDTLLKRTRREYHAQTAKWLSNLSGARAKDFLGATAEHFVKAGDHAQGCEFFTRAAEHAAARYAHEAATDYVAKALALTDAQTNPKSAPNDVQRDQQLLRWRLFDVRERTLDLRGRRTEQQSDIDAMQALADALGDNRRRCEVAWRRSTLAMRTGDFHAMENAASQAVALAEGVGDVLLELRGQHRLALALAYLGNVADGHGLAQDGLFRARTLGARQLEALFLNALSVIDDSQVDRLPSLDMDEQDLLINRELGNRRHQAIALVNLGRGWLRLGEHTQARRYLDEGLQLARAVGDRATQPDTLSTLSVLALRQDNAILALTHALAALDIANALQSPAFEASALWALGNAELALGRHAAATAAFERARDLALVLDNVSQYDAMAGLARVALEKDDVTGAMQVIDALLTHLVGNGRLEDTEAPFLIRLTCHQVLVRNGDPRAIELLTNAHAELHALATTITDAALRHSFMNNIPEHRAIVAAFSVVQTANTSS